MEHGEIEQHIETIHHEAPLLDESAWVAIAFLIFVILFARYVWPKIGAALDTRSANIAKEIEEAHNLKEEAQVIYAEAQRKAVDAEKRAEELVAHAKEEAKQIIVTAEKEMKAEMERKLKSAEDKLARAEQAAIDNVRAKAVEEGARLAEEALAEKLSGISGKKQGTKLVKDSIKKITTAI